jgi:hypothetical protein
MLHDNRHTARTGLVQTRQQDRTNTEDFIVSERSVRSSLRLEVGSFQRTKPVGRPVAASTSHLAMETATEPFGETKPIPRPGQRQRRRCAKQSPFSVLPAGGLGVCGTNEANLPPRARPVPGSGPSGRDWLRFARWQGPAQTRARESAEAARGRFRNTKPILVGRDELQVTLRKGVMMNHGIRGDATKQSQFARQR